MGGTGDDKMKTFFLLVIVIVMGIFFIASGLFAPQSYSADNDTCLACHPDLKEKTKSFHAALGMGCSVCHKQVGGKNHPAEKGSIELTQPMPGLCYTCHDEAKFKGKSVHQPVSGGMCTGCHNPHRSNYPKILLNDVPALCYNCHDQSKFKGNSGHTLVGMCNGCHDPHSSNSVNLLKGDQPAICYTCHEKSKFSKKYVHSIIPAGGCTSCHIPHTSRYPALLSTDIDELCSTCHTGKDGRHIVSIPGKRIHPIKGKDLSTVKKIKVPDPNRPGREIEIEDPNSPPKQMHCTTCHDPHSSDYENLFPQKNICSKCHQFH
jgi:predicted CXXCH cytochrome family protein